MAYVRRYLAGQQATTVVIAEGAITSDKIVDGAVTHPKIAPGAVDSERVVDESLKSQDIKDGEVKTVDIASGAITTDKIASQAVTVDKLEASIQGIARPLTPGVSTAEIQDDAVTESKLGTNSVGSDALKPGSVDESALAGDAVVTGKVKDGQITLSKMAPDSIDNTVIKAGTIRGTEIATGACGATELGTNAVETDKIKALAITEPKIGNDAVITRTILADAVTSPKLDIAALAQRHIESKEVRVLSDYEEFSGMFVSDKWQRIATGGYFIGQNTEDGVQLMTGAINGHLHRMNWDGAILDKVEILKPTMTTWIASRHEDLHHLTNIVGLWKDADNHIIFIAEDLAGATPNWEAKCRALGVETLVDTGVPITAAIQLLAIEVVDAGHVKFYIEGIEKAEITTNIPTGQNLGPWFEVVTRENDYRWIKVKYVSILANRLPYA